MFTGAGSLDSSVAERIRTEAHVLHRQLTPVWRRRTHHSRVLLLDTPLGDGLCLYDLVASCPDPQDVLVGSEPDDARLTAVLRALRPKERAVAMAWAHPGVTTWKEAALQAGAADPAVMGERVRRKTRRLTDERQRRLALQEVGTRPRDSVTFQLDEEGVPDGASGGGLVSDAQLRSQVVAPVAVAVGSGAAVAGPPWYVMTLAAGSGVVSALMPQESQHRRDAWRDWLKYRERRHLIRSGRTDLLIPPQLPRAEPD